MNIECEFSTQVRVATGRAKESIDLPDGTSLTALLQMLLERYPQLSTWIDPHGHPRPGLLIFINDQSPTDHPTLKPNDCLSLMALVSGG